MATSSLLVSVCLVLVLFTAASFATCPLAFNNLGSGLGTGYTIGPTTNNIPLQLATGWTTGSGSGYTFENANIYLKGNGWVTVNFFSGGTTTPGGNYIAQFAQDYYISASTFTLYTFGIGASIALNANTNYWIIISTKEQISWGYTDSYSALLPTAYSVSTQLGTTWYTVAGNSQRLSLSVTGCVPVVVACTLPSPCIAYKFIAQHSSQSVNINGPYQDADTALNQWTAMGGVAQESYYFYPNSDGSYYIASKFSGKRLDVRTSIASGNPVVQNVPNYTGDTQKWTLTCVGTNIFTISPKSNTGLIWSVAGASQSPGAGIVLAPTPSASNSKFLVVPW